MEDTIKPETEGFTSALFGIDICIVYEAKAIDFGITWSRKALPPPYLRG
jgi:hypothetical protein